MRINKNISRNILTWTDIEILEVIIIRLNEKYKIKYNTFYNIFQAKTSPPPPQKKKKYS